MPRLHVTSITSVGAVEAGDNPRAEILLFKKRGDMEKGTVLGQRIRTAREAKDLSTDQVAARLPISGSTLSQIERGEIIRPPDAVLAAIARALGLSAGGLRGTADQDKELGRDNAPTSKSVSIGNVADSEPPSKEHSMERPDLTSLSDEDQAPIVKSFEGFEELVKSLEAQVAELTPTPDPIVEESDEVKAEFAKRDSKIEDLQKALDAEKNTRERTEWVSKAKPLEAVVGNSVEAGARLQDIAAVVDEKVMEWLVDRLSTVANVIKVDTRLFKELGEGDAGDASEQIETLAKEAQKSNTDLTDEAARLLVRRANPALRDAEREERN